MKILMLISESPPVKSGVARVAEKLSLGLRSYGYQVDLLSSNEIPRFERGEVRLSSMPVRLLGLRERFCSYDLIHLHGPVPTFSDVMLLYGLRGLGPRRPRLVYTYHAPIQLTHPLLGALAWAYNLLTQRLARLADHVVVSTPSYAQRLARSVPVDRLSVIPWGVDFERFAAPVEKSGPFTVVYVGQIRPYKGLPVLLQAVSGLPEARLWVIGDGHHRQACEKLAAQAHLSQATFWGALPDEEMIRLLRQAHAIVLPSVTHSEAFGIALLEGMAAGLVPVASHLPGVVDVVGNEGFTFPPGNPQALRSILIRLYEDPALRAHLANLAQAKTRLYSWKRVAFSYDRVFKHTGHSPFARPAFPPHDIPTRPAVEDFRRLLADEPYE